MKTLKERAKEYADNYVVGDAAIIVDLMHSVAYDGYVSGAEEQKKIDIDKACEWLKKDLEGALDSNMLGYMLRHFRKAMEE